MFDWVTIHFPAATLEPVVRLGTFVVVFLALAWLERRRPRRALSLSRWPRWATNASLVALNTLVVRVMAALIPAGAAVAVASLAASQNFGLFNVIDAPLGVSLVVSVIVLDFAIWLQHVASHKIPLFWRLHQMHHADRDVDVTTAIRFHPIEIALSMLWKSVVVALLGAPVVSVIVFEVVLNAMAMFSHANIRVPATVDRVMRKVVVTPDMHRVHHSVIRAEHDSNYGFNLSLWDRLFRTYRAQPVDGHDAMILGLSPYQTTDPSELGWNLVLPFRPLGGGKSAGKAEKTDFQ